MQLLLKALKITSSHFSKLKNVSAEPVLTGPQMVPRECKFVQIVVNINIIELASSILFVSVQ